METEQVPKKYTYKHTFINTHIKICTYTEGICGVDTFSLIVISCWFNKMILNLAVWSFGSFSRMEMGCVMGV